MLFFNLQHSDNVVVKCLLVLLPIELAHVVWFFSGYHSFSATFVLYSVVL